MKIKMNETFFFFLNSKSVYVHREKKKKNYDQADTR